MIVCPACGQENPQGFRFCGACAAPLSAGAAARDERKIVTVLFCDLVGSTARAERLDPEDVRALLSRYHMRVRQELERFGGTVEKFIGDAVVALFGAPVSHEDDPERAVRAALAVREWAQEEQNLHVRLAVNTGEALVALGARPLEGEGMASGDVVNTAARLQAAAPVDGILVGEQTYHATSRVIEYREHEPVAAKGKAAPVPVWEVMQARRRLGVDLPAPTAVPMIGRDRELALLADATARAFGDRAPQLVTLVGSPGIGKTRLLAELLALLIADERTITWRQGRSLAYGEGVSFWAWGEIVKAEAGILETDTERDAAEKLGRAVARLRLELNEREWVESHLRPLVGVGLGELGSDRRGESFAAWRRFVEALADERPLVLVFEDVHCADDGLLDFVDQLVERLAATPVLIVAVARPELLARRPAWGGGKANAATLSLAPLSDEETARIVHELLQRAVLPAELQSLLLERAGGNPLYAEEFARMVVDRGSVELLPESIQAIIAARLDALASEEKALIQDAAVIGKVFWSGALAAVTSRERFAVEEQLYGVERRELIRRARTSSVAGETEYAFRHVLVRDVAYSSIPRPERAERHQRTARWIESLGRPDDHADMVAHHYLAALELLEAAGLPTGPIAVAAAAALQRAGDRAYALNAFENAAQQYERALAFGIPEGDVPLVMLRLGAALHYADDDRRFTILERARDLLTDVGDLDSAAEACLHLSQASWHRGETTQARAHVERAQELVQPQTAASARVLGMAARFAHLRGAHADSIKLSHCALEIANELGLEDVSTQALATLGTARAAIGDNRGIADLERAIELGLARNDPDVARSYNNLGSAYAELGDARRARELWQKGKQAAERLGNAFLSRFVTTNLIFSDYDAGDWDEALQSADQVIAECEAGLPHYQESLIRQVRSLILLGRDDEEGATAEGARCLEAARRANEPQTIQPALANLMWINLELGRIDDARANALELIEWLERGVAPTLYRLVLVAEALNLRAAAERLVARFPSSIVAHARALIDGDILGLADRFAESGRVTAEAEIRYHAARQLVAAGRLDDADTQLQAALAFYRSVGATRYLRIGQTLLAATA